MGEALKGVCNRLGWGTALMLFGLPGCAPKDDDSLAVGESTATRVLRLTTPMQDIGRQFLPNDVVVEFPIINESAKALELRKIESSCACQSFSIDGRKLTNGRDFSHILAPGSSCSLQVAIQIKPGHHKARFRLWSNTGEAPLNGQVEWEGVPPARLVPPEHNIGLRNLGETVAWVSRVHSTDGNPFTLRAAAACPPHYHDARAEPDIMDSGWNSSGDRRG